MVPVMVGLRYFRIVFAPVEGGTLHFTRGVSLTNECIEDLGLEFLLYQERVDTEREIFAMDRIRIKPIRLYELVQVFSPGESEPTIEERDFTLLAPKDRIPMFNPNPTLELPEVWP